MKEFFIIKNIEILGGNFAVTLSGSLHFSRNIRENEQTLGCDTKGNFSMGENRLEKIDVGINRLCQQISAPLRG